MTITSTRRTAALVGAALAVGSLPLLSLAGSADAAESSATTTYSKKLDYMCDVSVGYEGDTIALPDFPIVADVSFAVPSTLKPATTIESTAINVGLDLESLRLATVQVLGGVAAEGASTNVHLFVKSAEGSRTVYEIAKLAAPKADIPTDPKEPWIVKATGTAPTITIPNSGQVTIQAPEKFNIEATIYEKPAEDGTPRQSDAELTCETETSRTVAVIPVGEKTTVTPRLPSTIKARTASSFRTEVRGAATTPTGTVFVYLDDGSIINGDNYTLNANGDIRVALPKFGKLGKRSLTIQYSGDADHGAVLVKKTFTVTR